MNLLLIRVPFICFHETSHKFLYQAIQMIHLSVEQQRWPYSSIWSALPRFQELSLLADGALVELIINHLSIDQHMALWWSSNETRVHAVLSTYSMVRHIPCCILGDSQFQLFSYVANKF